jgi:hypothetical protein
MKQAVLLLELLGSVPPEVGEQAVVGNTNNGRFLFIRLGAS